MQLPNTLSVFGFSFPRNRKQYIFFKPCEVPTVFPFVNFSCEGSFFFGQSSNCLSADCFRCEQRCFYRVTSFGLVLYILIDLGPRGELFTKQTGFLVQPYARLARITFQKFACLFSPATILIASLQETHECAQHYAIVKWYASKPTQDKLNWD